MQNIDFKYLKAQNILCFGEKGLEINFTQLGNIVLIQGQNLDNTDDSNIESSNGSGKSSIIQIICYAIYGKHKELTQPEVIHNNAESLYVELHFNDYKIIRKRNKVKGITELWQKKDGEWINDTKGKNIQQEIERIIGINYQTFINIFVFSDDNSTSFLQCNPENKRIIIENLLCLDKYREYHESAKTILKNKKEELKILSKDYEHIMSSIEAGQKRLQSLEDKNSEWLENNKNSEKNKEEIVLLEEKYKNINKLFVTINAKKELLEKEKSQYLDSLADLNRKIKDSEHEIKTNSDNLDKIGKKCPYCKNIIKQENIKDIIDISKQKIEKNNTLLTDFNKQKELLTQKLKNINNLNIDKNYKDCKEKKELIEKNLFLNKSKTVLAENPYLVLLEENKKDITDKQSKQNELKEKIKKLEEDLPYYMFLTEAFGDNGIRRIIISNIIPVLNSRIEYWLQILINGKIKLTFDDKLDKFIDRYPFVGKSYVYAGLSNGQRRRLILALSQAFAYIMMMSTGISLSCLFLDEVTMNMDALGIDAIYRMICEISKEKQVFVIDHSPVLKNLLTGNKKIQLKMENGVSEIVY